jgi:predicted MPP superfamily phosphohydrolase
LPVDLCVLTGDYRFEVYGPCDRIYPRMRQVLDSVRSRFGIVGILGNHDCADIAIELEKMGVRMLVNESLPVGPAESPVWVAGVDDPHYYGCDDLPKALCGVPEQHFSLLLAHTPEMFREAAAAGIDLYLCGHTHAGQIRLPWIGPVIQFADSPRALAYGLWNHDGMQGYTTSGAGNSMLPIRFNCPPEMVVIELARA